MQQLFDLSFSFFFLFYFLFPSAEKTIERLNLNSEQDARLATLDPIEEGAVTSTEPSSSYNGRLRGSLDRQSSGTTQSSGPRTTGAGAGAASATGKLSFLAAASREAGSRAAQTKAFGGAQNGPNTASASGSYSRGLDPLSESEPNAVSEETAKLLQTDKAR